MLTEFIMQPTFLVALCIDMDRVAGEEARLVQLAYFPIPARLVH